MKKQSVFLYVLRLSLTLLVITSLMAAALAGVNMMTAPIIAKSNEAKTQNAVQAVLKGDGDLMDPSSYTDTSGIVSAVYAGENGYAVQVTPGGFGGEINMMVGVDKEGKVLGVSIISHAETPSLGAVAGAENEAGRAFRDSFIGLFGEVKVSKEGGEADTITSATITSKAVATGVNAALALVAGLG